MPLEHFRLIVIHSWVNHTYFTHSTFRVMACSAGPNSIPCWGSISLQPAAIHTAPSQLCQYPWDIKFWIQMEQINHFLGKQAMFWVIKCIYFWFYCLFSQSLLYRTYPTYYNCLVSVRENFSLSEVHQSGFSRILQFATSPRDTGDNTVIKA